MTPRNQTAAERLATPMPRRMRTLARDPRGYPIPYIVITDKTGMPQFTINDFHRVEDCVRKRLCGICGKRHDEAMWFVGGSRCFLHPNGAFLDPPVHLECAEYALRVCPFLAAPSYAKRIDDRKLAPGALPDDMALIRADYMQPMQPEKFGLGCARQLRMIRPRPGEALFIVERWDFVEFWHNGAPCNAPDEPVPADMPMERFA